MWRTAVAAQPCPPADWPAPRLQALASDGWRVTDEAQRQRLALALSACLSDPDPALRDEWAFTALQTWMRSGALTGDTVRALQARWAQVLAEPDDTGFAWPFAALGLAEVARIDRLSPWWTADERHAQAQTASTYLAGVRDYRGYDAKGGWRHGVAHGADWALQLVLNPKLDAADRNALIDAVFSQVAPPGEHAYRYGEPKRLGMVVMYAALRGQLDVTQWQARFEQLIQPLVGRANWEAARKHQDGLARLHNVEAFLQTLWTQLTLAKEPLPQGLQALRTAVAQALAKLP